MRKSIDLDDFKENYFNPLLGHHDIEKELKGFLYSMISAILFGILSFSVKLTGHLIPDYNINFFVLWRSLISSIIAYCMIRVEGNKLTNILEIYSNKWFIIRVFCMYASQIGSTLCMINLRGSTAQTIHLINSAFAVIFSVIILKEKFYLRYFWGTILCTLGIFIMVSNERNKGLSI